MKNLFLKKKSCSILLLLKDSQQQWYPSKLARVSGSSYVHAVNLLSALKAFGVVSVEKTGKQNIYKLTEKGQYIALSLDDFSKRCETQEQESNKPQPQSTQPPAPSAQPKAPEKQAQQAEKK